MTLNQGFEYSERVGSRAAGRVVLDYLSRRYRHSTEGEWRDRLYRGLVLLDGSPVSADALLREGQLLAWRRPPWDEPDVPLCYAVLHMDQALLAVAKPGGLPTLPAGGFLQHTLLTLVQSHYPEATPVHRLGRGTSGVVLFARTIQARKMLHRAFRQNEVIKIYRALAIGHPRNDSFTIDVPIGPLPHAGLGMVHAACAAGRRAVSHAKVLHKRKDCSLLEVRIATGRPHQIRIHLAAAGHPLLGDPLYTSGGVFKQGEQALPGSTGYFLHAHKLSLQHPVSGEPLEITCPPPPELRMNSYQNDSLEHESNSSQNSARHFLQDQVA